ncbi:MAG: phosphatidylserine/phosphatidylglycerophosphate/cardiolipin synthase family protein [Elusimicrobiales bacterium]|jgi:cardiolipin synthase|nr:phosphatidylserine/phosphatidylglycerophosphate/cardiolipin synthase family protein [Elusimicrobiales bacterium]
MSLKTDKHERILTKTVLFFSISLFLACFAGLTWGQASYESLLGQLRDSGGFDLSSVPDRAAPPPAADALAPSDKAALIAGFKEKLVGHITSNWHNPSRIDDAIVKELGEAWGQGVLEPVIVGVLSDPRLARFFPEGAKMSPEEAARMFSLYVGAELESNGHVPGVAPIEGWDGMTARHLAMARAGAYQPRRRGQPSLLNEAGFMAELAALQGTPFSEGNSITPLIEGAASFGKRAELIRAAKKSVFLTTWAFYDDATGNHTADLLIEKRRQGLDVRLMIDKDTAGLYDKGVLARMERAGIPVLRYQPGRHYYEFHSKILITDGKYAVLGGMNIGDVYSHMAGDGRWRDVDVLVQGPVMRDALRFFAQAWNAQAGMDGLNLPADAAAYDGTSAGAVPASIVWNAPGGEPYILLSMLKAVYGATERINIENAIIVMLPAMNRALLDARARGVEVNILSNSLETIGDKMMGAMILGSFPELIKAGANVYLKEGGLDTRLHSKTMTVDGVYGTVGSFNLQPRSIRYVMEVAANFTDRAAVAELDASFGQAVAKAKKARKVRDLDIPFMPIKGLIHKLMFNQL